MERLYSYPTEIVELEFADRISYLIRLWENFSKQARYPGSSNRLVNLLIFIYFKWGLLHCFQFSKIWSYHMNMIMTLYF